MKVKRHSKAQGKKNKTERLQLKKWDWYPKKDLLFVQPPREALTYHKLPPSAVKSANKLPLMFPTLLLCSDDPIQNILKCTKMGILHRDVVQKPTIASKSIIFATSVSLAGISLDYNSTLCVPVGCYSMRSLIVYCLRAFSFSLSAYHLCCVWTGVVMKVGSSLPWAND